MKHRLILGFSTLFFAAPLALASLAACGDDGETTSGKRVVLDTRVEAEQLSFTNGYGWNVTVDRALVSIGPLGYLEGAVVAQRWWAIREAHAHPGHYEAGGTIGEMLTPTSVDLVQGMADLGTGPGITGTALSARFTFQAPPEGPFAGELGTNVVLIEGSATSASETRAFRAVATVDDVLEGGAPAVVGCAFEKGSIGADGTVTVHLRPSVWLDQVDFALVPASADAAPLELARDQTPHKAFVRGLKKAAAYGFSYAPRLAP
jgi:hypothetical protein